MKNEMDKKQQELLKHFDKEMFTYTGQVAWLLPGIFSFISLILACIPFSTYGELDILMVYPLAVNAFIADFVLMPYEWCTESFTPRKKMDQVSLIFEYIPISKKNYKRVRMEYLFQFFWKLTVIALVLQGLVSAFRKCFGLSLFHVGN